LDGNDHTATVKRIQCPSCRRWSTIRVNEVDHRGDRKYANYD